MSLPIRTTLDDVDAVCSYLATKPTGATTAEAKAVLDKKRLDGRKLSALKFWGLMEEDGGRMRLTESGRQTVRDDGAHRSKTLLKVIRSTPPYAAVIERAVHGNELTVSATEVAAHWHEHFRDNVSSSDKILNDQAVCFFQIAEGADLGVVTVGRKGQPTRFDFDSFTAQAFVEGTGVNARTKPEIPKAQEQDPDIPTLEFTAPRSPTSQTAESINRVFITHGKNRKILEQVKEIVAFGKFEPVVAQEHETTAKPVPEKVMDDMRTCQAAVIHVGSEGVSYDKDGNEHRQINGNVLIEIGAAMALYGRDFILLVEDGLELPSNLQGLYECRYEGDELNTSATMKLLKAFNEFE